MQLIIIVITSFAFLLAILFFIQFRLARVKDSGDLQAELQKEAEKLFKHDLARDLSIIVTKNGRVLELYQSKDIDRANATRDSIYEVGSISKVFTSTLLSVIVADGKLKLDDNLQDLIGDRFDLADHIKPITLEQLATHTSGIPRVPKVMLNKLEVLDNPYSTFTIDDIAEYLKAAKQFGKPGKFNYSNLGMGLLGHIMEWKTGKSLDELVKTHIVLPLEMTSTGFVVKDEDKSRFVDAFDPKGNLTPHWDFPILAGAGGIRSTPSDMLKFLNANLEGVGSLSDALKATHPNPQTGDVGLGWMGATFVERFLGNKNLIWHNGLVGGHASYMSFDKTNHTGVLVLSNKAMDLQVFGSKLLRLARIHSVKQ